MTRQELLTKVNGYRAELEQEIVTIVNEKGTNGKLELSDDENPLVVLNGECGDDGYNDVAYMESVDSLTVTQSGLLFRFHETGTKDYADELPLTTLVRTLEYLVTETE